MTEVFIHPKLPGIKVFIDGKNKTELFARLRKLAKANYWYTTGWQILQEG